MFEEFRMIPTEDRGPDRLRDYGHMAFAAVEADPHAMTECAARWKADADHVYAPHAAGVVSAMIETLGTESPFSELEQFLKAHGRAQEVTLRNIQGYAAGTHALATAAAEIAARFRESDEAARSRIGAAGSELGTAGPGSRRGGADPATGS
ncbi:hypothetical protein [Actinoplanes sp. NBRC 101535]|uniref:hypothetical protein n=1 Tax=Actinoplanes sp. NBRC 101535 TaxID=3032196 RepID=UPI0024A0AB25|nr:hypothetical protein [Actinoplanes sp. NBRC 101535]GLY00927.1 hypothetical protein Acsp01_13060 [Actinoplanes sp. NBRC 101535]